MIEFVTNQRLAQLAGVNYNQEEVLPGRVVYSRTHEVVRQFSKLSTFGPCVLITSFSDSCVTDQMADMLPKNVKRWYSNNVDTDHPLVVPVPIGIRTSTEVESVLRSTMTGGGGTYRNMCYVNFLVHKDGNVNGNNARRGLYDKFKKNTWMTFAGGDGHIPIQDYYRHMTEHFYVISPPGAGPDCHRHWESLYLGAIPVVLRSRVTEKLLSNLPHVFVDNWDQVTSAYLTENGVAGPAFNTTHWRILDMRYWHDTIVEDTYTL
jgi:hypothetical protein